MQMKLCVACFLIIAAFAIGASAQTNIITYQGRLTDGASAANGTYQMTFSLFDALSGGAQQGSTITNNSVSVAGGAFTVQLDFSPATPFAAGANRFLEIAVRKAGDPPGFTVLTPRQQITSSPYSIRTLSASSADSLSALCVGCVSNANINTVAGSKITGTVANATTAVNVSGTVAIANGGTGAGNASTARSNLGAASSGSNSDITSLSSLSTPLSISQGGTGAANAANARANLGLGTLATVSPTGTANTTTFLRGDNTWAGIPPGSPPLMFVAQFSAPASTSANFVGLNGNNPQAVFGTTATLMALPASQARTFKAIYVAATITANAASDTLTLTMIKNGSATALTAQVIVTTLNATVTATDTTAGHAFSVVAGDQIAIQITQTTSTPIVRLSVSTYCE